MGTFSFVMLNLTEPPPTSGDLEIFLAYCHLGDSMTHIFWGTYPNFYMGQNGIFRNIFDKILNWWLIIPQRAEIWRKNQKVGVNY